MHYYKRNLGDYAKKTGRLSMLQHGAYTLLIDSCYDREQFPTLRDALDWTWASSKEEIEAVEFVLSKFFVLENGVFVQKRIQEEIEEYRKKSETNARIAAEREAKRLEHKTNRERIVNESLPLEHESPPNQEPRTINQEPLTTIKNNNAGAFVETPEFQPAEPDRIPYGKILDLYHETLPEMRKVVKLTDTRKTHLRMRWKNELPDMDEWRKYFLYVRMSPFLMGMTNPGFGKSKPFQADFDFLINGSNAVKIAEGKYHG